MGRGGIEYPLSAVSNKEQKCKVSWCFNFITLQTCHSVQFQSGLEIASTTLYDTRFRVTQLMGHYVSSGLLWFIQLLNEVAVGSSPPNPHPMYLHLEYWSVCKLFYYVLRERSLEHTGLGLLFLNPSQPSGMQVITCSRMRCKKRSN
jgi:hypothetical protein